MKNKRHTISRFVVSGLLTLVLGFYSWGVNAQQPCPDAPVYESVQFFCPDSVFAQIGEDGDRLGDLQIFPDDFDYTLTWYSDEDLTQPIADPKTHPLQDGDVYYVTQTDTNGCESDALMIVASERDCGCIKDPSFQDQQGGPADRGYEAYQFVGIANHKTCGQTMQGANPLPLGTIDGYSGTDDAVLVTQGFDPTHINTAGNPTVTIPNLSRTNPDNPLSTHAFRLNRGAEYGGPGGNTNITSMSKEFIAGQVFVFNFALILQNPNHQYHQQPFAQVTLYDQNDNIIQRRCLVSDSDDCIFNSIGSGSSQLLYSDWSCMKLNTMDYIGQPVRAEFVTAYCTPTQHYAFMYIDDLYVGDDYEDLCTSASFGYAMINSVTPAGEDCYIGASFDDFGGCALVNSGNIPGYPVYICGVFDAPISQGPPPTLADLTLNIIQNDAVVGTITDAQPGSSPNTFCFLVEEADINVLPYGSFTCDVELDFALDCGSEYHFYVDDRSSFSLCPTAGCPEMLIVCDISGDGYSQFDLTQQDALFFGTQWTTDDVDLTYFTSEEDAHDNSNPITDPENFENDTPNFQTVYIRMDWDVEGAPSDCYYLVPLDLEVIPLPPYDDWVDVGDFCVGETIDFPIVATPDNVTDLQQINYKWYKDGNQIPYSGSIYHATETGVYTVIVSEQDCEVEKTVTIQEFGLSVDLGDPSIDICTEDGVAASYTIVPDVESIGATDIDMDDVTYLWSTGDTTKDLTVTESGTYTLEVSYGDCTYMDTKSILLTTRPEIALLDNLVLCKGDMETVVLDITHPDNSLLDIDWYRDGGLIAQNVEQLDVSEPGIYKVIAGETLATDCHEEITFTVDYYNNENCVVPEGLSPNNDGYNDNLDLAFLHDKHGVASLQIFNRHGLEVYSKDNYTDEWYGQSKDDKTLPVGVYFYIIKLKDGSDDITGNIYLNY